MIPTGRRNAITDVPGLRVGNARDDRLKSGATVLTAERPFVAAVDVRGGAPGTRETDLLAPGRLVAEIDALVLSGGSAFGLDAASGAMDRLRATGRGFFVAEGVPRVPIVPAAILFDLANGGAKDWGENPYRALGAAAFDAASEDFALGSEGAGTGAMTRTVMGGLGSASFVLPDGTTVGALVAVNAVGTTLAPGSRHFLAGPFEIGDEFGGLGPTAERTPLEPFAFGKPGPADPRVNTTIAIVATDAALDKAGARRLAEVAHGGFARAIHPSHTPFDGDLIFAVSTGARPVASPLDELQLGQAAAICLARAIARGVHAARPQPGNPLPCWCEL
ncbi:D-aminopeptidase [Amaricoccus macauensis]|uniref:D-aminopeptidase n=1 Tax=Amaricoccus macauensis TaxID=57001 RepID=A0A840SL51_9RHOB|nr:P1 family peptidase [Amaricoccus macauensis]MBB5220878.1 D-aminopeptidase [Amaricoccus macauensis]